MSDCYGGDCEQDCDDGLHLHGEYLCGKFYSYRGGRDGSARMESVKTKATSGKKKVAVLHPFDAMHGTDTDGLIVGKKLGVGHKEDAHITAYHGTAPSVFMELIELWQATGPKHAMEEITFLDVGAGKGRAMLLASELPFKKVVGIELNPELAAVCRANMELWRGKAWCAVTLVESDVASYVLPEGPLMVYLFNPFGPPVLKQLIAKILRHADAVDVLYVNHECDFVFDSYPRLKKMYSGSVELSPEDAAADHRTILRDAKGIYASTGDENCSIYRFEP